QLGTSTGLQGTRDHPVIARFRPKQSGWGRQPLPNRPQITSACRKRLLAMTGRGGAMTRRRVALAAGALVILYLLGVGALALTAARSLRAAEATGDAVMASGNPDAAQLATLRQQVGATRWSMEGLNVLLVPVLPFTPA